jgi:hypothetical protein
MKKKFFYLPAYDQPATGGITLVEVDAAIPEFWANVALGALKANTVMANLVNRDYSDAVATKGDVVNIVKRGSLQVNDKVTGHQITLQTPSNSKIPVTLNKHKEISWLIEDTASAEAIQSAVDYVTDAAIALGEQIDADLLARYSGLTLQAGGANTPLGINSILEAREKLNVAKAPVAGRYFVISPQDETALLKLEQFTSAEWTDENQVALREATIGKKYGFIFVMDQQVKTTVTPGTNPEYTAASGDALYAVVTNPAGQNPYAKGWYTKSGSTYSAVESTETTPDASKTYYEKVSPKAAGWYERSGEVGSYVYTLTTDETQGAKTYYILTTPGTDAKTQRHNIAFHKDALTLVTRPLPAPPAGSGAVSSSLQVDGISVRVTRSYSQKDGGMLWTLDILYGIAGLRSDTHGVHVLAGDANA